MKRVLWMFVLLLFTLSLVACSGGSSQSNDSLNNSTPSETNGSNQQESDQSDAYETVYPLTITDASGLEMTFEKPPERIVSLSPSETEVLFALGLGDKIVGVTEWCTYPEEAKSKPKIGDFQVNIEALLAAEPDLVMAGLSANRADAIESYRELGLTVFAVEPTTIDEIMERILTVGKITNTQKKAHEIVEKMTAERQRVLDAVQGLSEEEKKTVYIEFNEGWTVGSGEFLDELITLAGGINVAAHTEGWYTISEERIIQDNPDVILYAKNVDGLEDIIRQRNGWNSIEAIQNDRVIGVDDDIVSRTGPRITEGLLAIAQAIYPELVN